LLPILPRSTGCLRLSQLSENIGLPFLDSVLRKVLCLQILATTAIAAVGGLAAGQLGLLSAFCGGGIVVVGNLAYAWVARPSRMHARSGSEVLLRHVLAQLAKLSMVLGLMSVAFVSGFFVAGWLLAGVAASLMGHWISLLFLR
jgi:hypothetical protein